MSTGFLSQYDLTGDEPDSFRELDAHYLAMEADMTPTRRLACIIAEKDAQLQLADEQRFWMVAEIARLNALLGQTTFQTVKTP